jgi:hypothetical protein
MQNEEKLRKLSVILFCFNVSKMTFKVMGTKIIYIIDVQY